VKVAPDAPGGKRQARNTGSHPAAAAVLISATDGTTFDLF